MVNVDIPYRDPMGKGSIVENDQSLMLTAPFCSRGFGVLNGCLNTFSQGIWSTRHSKTNEKVVVRSISIKKNMFM